MSRIAYSQADVTIADLRRRYIPIASTLGAGLLVLLPIVTNAPYIPDFAFLVLIAWRLLRPEMWSARTALALGLFNDFVAGHPLGQSMALWTLTFLAFDLLETRTAWRDYWIDWFAASVAIIFYTCGGWYISRLMGSTASLTVMIPQILLSILAYPIVARLVLALDRRRLSR